jgi:hypothetical protein
MKTFIKSILLFLLLGLLCVSCDRDEVCQDSDYIEFGQYYGFCVGEKCIEIFRLDNANLYEDTTDIYPSETLNDDRKFVSLSSQKFDQAKDLKKNFPQQLLNESKVTFGIPDAYDQGGRYLRYKSGEVNRVWLFDNNLGEVPVYLHSYLNEVVRVKELLSE